MSQEFDIKGFGGQQKPSALARFMGMARGFAMNTLLLGGAVIVADKMLPHDWKPSVMIGQFIANIENNDIRTKQAAVVEFARRQSEATVLPQVAGQIEAETARHQVTAVHESLGVETFMANVADAACAVGGLFTGAKNRDWRDLGGALRAGCGASAGIRDHIVSEEARAARAGTAVAPREVVTPPQAQAPPAPREVRTPPPETAPAPPGPHITILRVKPVHFD